MVVVLAIESAESVLTLVDFRVKLQIAVDIGVDDEVRRLSHYDLIAKDADSEWRDQFGVLHEDMRIVGFAVPVRVFKNDDTVTSGSTVPIFAIVDSFRDPDPPLRIGVHVSRVHEHWTRGPSSHLEIVRHCNLLSR